MSLLSKLFGKDGEQTLDQLKSVAQTVKDGVGKTVSKIEDAAQQALNQANAASGQPISSGQPAPSARVIPYGQPAAEYAPYGVSWGSEMPAEENQYSSGKSFDAYFLDVYSAAFPEYRLVSENPGYAHPAVVFTFWQGERMALVVEVLSERSGVCKLRNQCRTHGVPYLRFYHDHDGWWNTRSYVTARTRAALEGRR